jgi:hypothetical protein
MPITGKWMKLEIIRLSEISQTKTNITFSLYANLDLKNDTSIRWGGLFEGDSVGRGE